MKIVGEGTANIKKRKGVSDGDRKRATYSCDRCKVKKIRCDRLDCNRVKYDRTTSCVQCNESNIMCTTTAPRKKRTYYSMSDTSRYQLKCLICIAKAIFPDKNPNDLNDLFDIAECLNIELPEGNKGFDDNGRHDVESFTDVSRLQDGEMDESIDHTNQVHNKTSSLVLKPVTTDRNENASSYGLEGTLGLLKALLGITAKVPENAYKEDDELLNQKLEKASPINVNIETILELFQARNFHPSSLISKSDADYYVNFFFENVHPGYFIFEEQEFRRKHDCFFRDIGSYKPCDSVTVITNEQICCIYMVWILGKEFSLSIQKDISDNILNLCLSVVRLLLGDIIIHPSLEGIRLVYLIALYFESQKKRETSWQLFELASQQCISLRFHRQAAISSYPENIQDEIKVVWWSIFRIQMNINSSLGRAPSVPIETIDIGLPSLITIKDELFRDYFASSVGLFKIMYKILNLRRNLYISNEPLSIGNIDSLTQIKMELSKWFSGLSQLLKEYWVMRPVKRYQLKLHLQYHYLCITLTLPYLLYISKSLKEVELANYQNLIESLCQGIKAAETICDVIYYSEKSGQFNGLLHYDMFYGYNAMMVLILTYVLIHDQTGSTHQYRSNCTYFRKTLSDFGIDRSSNLRAIHRMHLVNVKHSSHVEGLMKEACENIKFMIKRFGLLKVLNTKYGSPRNETCNSSLSADTDDDDNKFVPLSPSNSSIYGLNLFVKDTENQECDLFLFGYSDFELSSIIFNENFRSHLEQE
ncbi:unnamed protein product [Debaryomyces fabryi]|nr:unnamed protein product [Debaryomyces fabryi]